MAAKKNFYAVVAGRKPGVYARWSGPGGAEDQVKGFAGAVYRGFSTREEAEAFYRSGGKLPEPPAALFAQAGKASGAVTAQAAPPAPDYAADLAQGKVVVFTDGASTGNPGPGGYGVVILAADARSGVVQRRELSGGFRRTTNNRMELLACIAALQSLPAGSRVVLYSDSRYVVNAVTLGWARRWRAAGWQRAAVENGQRQRAENADLWAQMLDLLDQHAVEMRWVKGHANHPENERCDRLAVQAAARPGLPDDPGFA